jgi:selenocysteine-specific elongation factor
LRSFIVGTAGHIDHGKSTLVLALTGTDPDRLKEEKVRGITIDLGFAHAPLAEGIEASFVDVPGHERFVRNMLAGAHGLDAVMLVVAADEAVMPQTREHFEICRLLGIRHGLVALTKCDLADAETRALAESEVRELVAGSFLEGSPVVPVSAKTGEGLDALRARLLELARGTGERSSAGLMRLPIDRVFTLRGFGTVVTGTLTAGALAVGDEVEILPAARRARVRGLQVHGAPAPRVSAGHRTAANLVGVEVEDLGRGDVLVHPGTLRASSMLDVEIVLLSSGKPLLDGSRVRVHVASAEVLARVRLLGQPNIAPGGRELAQLRLEKPVLAGRADRLVLRSYSPAQTIGGARVLDPGPPKRRRVDRARLFALAALVADDVVGAAGLLIEEAGAVGMEIPALAARLTLPQAELLARLASADAITVAGRAPGVVFSRSALAALESKCLALLERFHHENPLKQTMPREELRRRALGRAASAGFEPVLEALSAKGLVRLAAEGASLPDHGVRMSPEEDQARGLLLREIGSAGLAGVELAVLAASAGKDRRLLDRVARVLLDERTVRRVGEAFLVEGARLDQLARNVRERWPPGSRLDVAGFKELTGLTRKFVIPLLEYLDRERVTRRAGAERFVL